MNLEYKYWYFEKGLPSTICNDVIKHALAKKTQNKAGTLSIDARKKLNKKQAKDLKKYRNSNIVWLKDQWIFDAIIPFVNTANKKAGWNFEIDKAETILFIIKDTTIIIIKIMVNILITPLLIQILMVRLENYL